MNFYLQYFRHINRLSHRSSTAGFTLTEVLLAGMMMLFVVLVAGMGVLDMLKSNIKANAQSEIQGNVNRAIEFISDEVKHAKTLAKNQDEITTAIPTGGRAVLAFSIPNPNNPSQELSVVNPDNPDRKFEPQVVYYTKAAESYQLGPRVLWRYGPRFDANGDYVTPDNLASWNSTPLVDMLVNSAQVTDKDCNPYGDGAAGWNRTDYKTDEPTNDNNIDGFFACVNDRGNLALIRANSEVPIGVYTKKGKQEIPKYSVDTKISTRTGGDFGFDILQSHRVVLTKDVTVTPEIINGNCKSKGEICMISVEDPDDPNLSDRNTVDFTTLSGKAGGEIVIFKGLVSSIYGNVPGYQSVKLYTYGQPLPSGMSIKVRTNQVLYVLKDLTSRPNQTFTVLVTIKPR